MTPKTLHDKIRDDIKDYTTSLSTLCQENLLDS